MNSSGSSKLLRDDSAFLYKYTASLESGALKNHFAEYLIFFTLPSGLFASEAEVEQKVGFVSCLG